MDRQAFNLTPEDVLLVITSAGCNVLDYALLAPKRIHAVDANPRQTALLELKVAGVRALEFEDFFSVFGEGCHPAFPTLYNRFLREQLSDFARGYWDKRVEWFAGKRGSFYFHGCRVSWPAVSKPTSLYARLSAGMCARCLVPARSMSSAPYTMSASPRKCGARRCDGPCRVNSPSACWACPIPSAGR